MLHERRMVSRVVVPAGVGRRVVRSIGQERWHRWLMPVRRWWWRRGRWRRCGQKATGLSRWRPRRRVMRVVVRRIVRHRRRIITDVVLGVLVVVVVARGASALLVLARATFR